MKRNVGIKRQKKIIPNGYPNIRTGINLHKTNTQKYLYVQWNATVHHTRIIIYIYIHIDSDIAIHIFTIYPLYSNDFELIKSYLKIVLLYYILCLPSSQIYISLWFLWTCSTRLSTAVGIVAMAESQK